ncbi:MAG TPA: GNAT family N-acetyltransferase [Kofleriaceae bacterium]|nr:GNAT family N-acetyltransferase [Kofleriaceae bacterium]
MGTLAISVRRAQISDAPALADLVNRAYAVEQFFVDGNRTTVREIEQLLERGVFLVLEHGDALAAAVYVDVAAAARGESGYFGMLSVDPELQGMGLGTRLVRNAEAMCEAMGATEMRLKIVNLREELARWYKSLGYREVGTAPYTHRPVKQACHFVEMHKPLCAPALAAAS